MEIKDINNLTNMVMGTAGQGQQAPLAADKKASAGLEFIDLLNNKDFFKTASLTDDKDTQTAFARVTDDGKTIKRKSKNKTAEFSTEVRENGKNEKKSPIREKTSKSEKTENEPSAEEAPVSPEKSSDNKETVSSPNEKIKNPEENKAEPENGADIQEVPATETGDRKNAETVSVEIAYGVEIPLSDIVEMGTVTVYNAETGNYSVMSGADLAEMLSSGQTELMPFESLDGKSDVTLVMQPVAAPEAENVEMPDIDLNNISRTDGRKTKDHFTDNQSLPQPAENAETFVDNKEEVVFRPVEKETLNQEESAKLSEVLGKNTKAEIKVSVEEENFSFSSTKEDFSAKNILQGTDADNANLPSQNNQPQPVNVQPANMQNNQMGNQAAAISVSAVSAGAENAVSENASSTTVQNAAAVDVQNAAKPAARTEIENKTSLRDVYKGMGKEAIEQIKVNITKSAVKGVDTINVKLKPEELGHIEIKMQIAKDGKLQAHIISSRAETMDMLQKEMSSLEKAFNDAGFETDSNSFSFSFREDQQSERQKEANGGLRSFLGDMLEKEADNENMAAEKSAYENWDGKSALNIRV